MEHATHTPVRRAAVVFVFVTVLIDILAFGIIIPVLPHLIEQMTGGTVSNAAWWVGVFGTVFATIQFVFSPIQGALSDRFGRRPVILLSNLGLGLDFVFMALAPSLTLLFVGRIISGMTAASFTTANAYIADVTPPEKRSAAFGLLGGAFGIGFIIGPALGGFLGGIDLRLPFWVAAGLALTNFLYGFFILPESLPAEHRAARFELRSANPLGALKLLRRNRTVFGLSVVMFLFYLAHYVLQTVFVLYADYRYGWGPQAVGYVLALVGACDGSVQAFLTGRLTARFGERRILLAGLVFGTAAFATMGFASVGWVFLIGIPLMSLWGLAGPPIQSIMTRHVAPDEQGRLQGGVTSLGSFAGIFGPYLFAQIFAFWISPDRVWHVAGMPFLLAAVLVGIGIVVAARATRPGPKPALAGET
ncbi:MFS transporter, DHA1 family, tetracycline resistance protein [Luteibacter sp. UNCMF331Sha3.1]|uniref:TCR/Tet family MFS transporter n=1 Tax=Luteibacter sp. UNCMF331Sha3.1 TaxID=1502760 RepID=UPI0008C59233|nr:TCR/Tet family MFS transporter [Luteibacter sp. UNCMF331Sha3.1]SEM42386.1 MFS transporter, DHA1 family, tetracycline resistance protein [Luteibacter sp. UNCMF331Sha3.1]